MSKKSFRQAINEALHQEMRRDPRVDRDRRGRRRRHGAPGERRCLGRRPGRHQGTGARIRPHRVFDTPITESAFIGAAAGAAATGLRPVAELMFADFVGVCFDQIFNQAAKFRYMFGGKATTPWSIRTMYRRRFPRRQPAQPVPLPDLHPRARPQGRYSSSPYEAKGLLIQAIRDNDPVIFFEHKVMYDMEEEVPDEPYTIPFGEANLTREGDDVTIVAIGRMVAFRQ